MATTGLSYDYPGALGTYSKLVAQPYSQMMSQLMPALQQMMSYYAPGGGYGQGQRTEAAQQVQGGLGQDIGQMVASGMSGQFGARGAGTRAGTQLSTLYKNIEDTRANLWQQSVQPYAQIMSQMASIFGAKPTAGQYGATTPNPMGIGTSRTPGGGIIGPTGLTPSELRQANMMMM